MKNALANGDGGCVDDDDDDGVASSSTAKTLFARTKLVPRSAAASPHLLLPHAAAAHSHESCYRCHISTVARVVYLSACPWAFATVSRLN